MSNYVLARRIAEQRTTGAVSAALLQCFPQLVALCDEPEPAYRDIDFTGPVMATWKEASILHALVKRLKPTHALEIGTSVGWTAAHILLGMPENSSLTAVDPFNETATGLDRYNPDVLERLNDNIFRLDNEARRNVGFHIYRGMSPEAVPQSQWDFVFIDGWHRDGQPLRDVEGVLPNMNPHSVIVMHDFFMPDVQAAGRFLVCDNKWYFTGYLSRHQIGVFVKDIITDKGEKYPRWWRPFQDDVSKIFLQE